MKKIHPKWNSEAKITCACGNTFSTGATFSDLNVEVCYNCHPHYTGQVKYLDTAGRVDAFNSKMAQATKYVSKADRMRMKKEKKVQEEMGRPETLSQLRQQI